MGSFCPSESRRTRRVDAFLGFRPPEHSLPPALASALIAGDPLARVGRFDVPVRLRLRVSKRGRIGWPLSGLPALLGFITFRPSRHRCDLVGERAYGFASRLARVASGANRSEFPRPRSSRRFRDRPGVAVHR
jgi:hypothetical protein